MGVGEAHIAGYNSHPECEVVALCDFDKKKADDIKSKYPNYFFTENADDILSNPDINIVSIASYDNYHYEQIIKAINYDKHIFVEKPLCQLENEAIEIRAALDKKPYIKMASNLILRKSFRFKFLKEKLLAGEFGEIFYIEGDYNYGRLHKITDGWRGKIEHYSGIFGGGVHIVDLFLWLIGDLVEEVSAYGNSIASKGSEFKNNDLIMALLKFKNGIVGKVGVNLGCVYPHFHVLNIYGTKGTFVNSLKNAQLFESRNPEIEPKEISIPYKSYEKGDMIYNFIETIIKDSVKPEITINEIFNAMSICLSIEKSIKENKKIIVNYI